MTLSSRLQTLAFLALASVAYVGAPALEAQETPPSLEGSVRAPGYRSDGHLIGAMVEVRQADAKRYATVDAEGRYHVDGLHPGPAEVFVFHIAAHPLEVRVTLPDRGPVHLDLSLRHRVIELQGLEVRPLLGLNAPIPPLRRGDRGRVELGLRSLDASSGMAESGLVSALASGEPTDPEGVLFMRGSTLDSRVILLDGAPVLTPFHVAGLIEPFASTWLGQTKVYLGGAPSPYAGGLSYLMDVDTRPARRDGVHGSLAADGLTVHGSLEAPLPLDGSVLLGGRFLHGLQSSAVSGARFPYRYDDLLLRAGFHPARDHQVRVTAFGNAEGVRLDLAGDSSDAHEAHWGNRALSIGYEGRVGATDLEANLAASRYSNRLPVDWQDAVIAEGLGDRYRLDAQVARPSRDGWLRAGGTVERIGFRYRLDRLTPRAETRVADLPLRLETTSVGMFGEWEGRLTPALDLRAGLRADHYSHEGRVRLSPRFSLSHSLGEDASVFGSVGLYHQAVPAPGLWTRPELDDAPAALGWDPALPVARASHLVVGVDQTFDERIQLGVSGFVKGFSGMGSTHSGANRASGMEVSVARESDRLNVWFGYALSWFWEAGGSPRPGGFEGRHLLTGGLETRLPTGARLRGAVGYGSGIPWTAVDVATTDGSLEQSPSVPLSDFNPQHRTVTQSGGIAPLEIVPQGRFLRLDLELSWPLELQVGGRDTRIRPYLKLMNALDQRDALFYYLDRWQEEEARPIAEQSVLPLAGVEWVF